MKKTLGGIAALWLLAGGLTTMLYASEPAGGELTPGAILDKVRANYAALVSYSDQGTVVAALNATTTTTTFDIRLARQNFYLVRWTQDGDASVSTDTVHIGKVWSSGADNFLQLEDVPHDEGSVELTLGLASPYSAGVTATVPMVFFDGQLGDALGSSTDVETRQADAKVGKVDCYVVSRESLVHRKTFWIGKDDLLIHKIQTIATVDDAAVTAGEFNRKAKGSQHPVIYTETHNNILVNQALQRSDFIP